MKSFYQNCKGQVVIIVAISLIVLIGMVGLAVDSGRAYGVKAKQSAAVDAASIAAARNVSVGNNDDERKTNARNAAEKFYYENFPDNYLGATTTSLNTIVERNQVDGFWQITVSATAEMPTTFIRVLSQDKATVGASGQATRYDMDMILVLDTSGSLNSPSGTYPKLQSAAINFLNHFNEGTDRIGFVSFSSGASDPSASPQPADAVPINKTIIRGFSKAAITSAITAAHDPNNASLASGSTASAEAMRKALNEINKVPANMRAKKRFIVFFSDGAPNGVPATFTWSGSPAQTGDLYSETSGSGSAAATKIWDNNQRDSPYPNGWTRNGIATLPNSGFNITGVGNIPLYDASLSGQRALTGTPYSNTYCNVNKAAKNMVEYVANEARKQGITIFTMGLGAALDTLETSFSGGNCGYTTTNESGTNIMKRIANQSDSATFHPPPQKSTDYVYAANADQLTTAFDTIAQAILRLTM